MSELVAQNGLLDELLDSCHDVIMQNDDLFGDRKERAAALLAAKDALVRGGHGDALMVRVACHATSLAAEVVPAALASVSQCELRALPVCVCGLAGCLCAARDRAL
jgi:hypothetical protein